jgi:hypothetical protein
MKQTRQSHSSRGTTANFGLAAQEQYMAAHNALEQLCRFPFSEPARELIGQAHKAQEVSLRELGIDPEDAETVFNFERLLGLSLPRT